MAILWLYLAVDPHIPGLLLLHKVFKSIHDNLMVGKDKELCTRIDQCLDKITDSFDLGLPCKPVSLHERTHAFNLPLTFLLKVFHVVVEQAFLVVLEAHQSLDHLVGLLVTVIETTIPHLFEHLIELLYSFGISLNFDLLPAFIG
jgi:hypothetical protein